MSTRFIDIEATSHNIKRILEEKGVTPREVQEALQFDSVQAIYKWMNPKNKSLPSLDSLVQLAYFLNCSLEDLLIMKETEIDDD